MVGSGIRELSADGSGGRRRLRGAWKERDDQNGHSNPHGYSYAEEEEGKSSTVFSISCVHSVGAGELS
jgi:hypothetical protein